MTENTGTSEESNKKSLKPPFKRRPIPPSNASALSLSRSQSSLSNIDVGQQPELNTATLIPLTPLDSLPTLAPRGKLLKPNSRLREKRPYLANDDIASFLEDELDLARLNRIHGHLWMCGRPMRAQPLHRYTMMGMSVLYTQQMDLHLLKFSSRLLLKPLPEWMLCYNFWDEHICPSEKLHKSAAGFILSYVWLVTTPLDLKIAHDHTLLPSFVTWHWWKEFVRDFYQHIDMETLEQVNKRYNFGDLRLGRINSIYRTRFFFTHYVRGYLYGYNRYTVFFQRNFSWILIVFVFFSLVLSAMQVGTGLNKLGENHAFQEASYVFVVFSMASVAAILCLITLIFVGIFLFNMVAAMAHANNEQAERKKKAKNKKSA